MYAAAKFTTTILMVMGASALFVSYAFAEPLGSYCISKISKMDRKQRPKSDPDPFADKPAPVTVSVDGITFHIVASNDRLLLKRGEDETSLFEMRAPQDEFKRIDALTLGKNGWFWIDGGEIDYMVQLNLNGPLPTFGLPVALPELMSKPCSILQRFLGGCTRASGIYSATLDRVFLTGYRVTFLGRSNLISFEISAGIAKQLPPLANSARFVVDVPKLNGALLKGPSNEALFYDGVAVTDLLARGTMPDWYILRTPTSNRTFLTSIGRRSGQTFLKELKAGPMVTPIAIPNELANSWLSLFTLPNSPRLWGVTRHGVVAEVGGELQTVVVVPAPSFTDGPAGVWQAPNGEISFGVRSAAGSSTDYSLVRATPPNRCFATLNADKQISLANE